MNASYVVPVVKDRIGDTADVNKYRKISAISSVVFKLFEWNGTGWYLEPVNVSLVKHSCGNCSFVSKKTVN